MDKKLKKWEAALMAGALCALCLGAWLNGEREALSGEMIRLHVIANSDSEADQELKLSVRDRVLAAVEELCPEGAGLEEIRAVLEDNLALLAQAGRETVEEWGQDYPVTASLEETWFPTKEYDGFALPAGRYTALRVVIGAGAGQNWWCVAFPPLCLGAASETLEAAEAAGYLTPGQTGLMTGADGGYVRKFKGMELLGELQRLLGW